MIRTPDDAFQAGLTAPCEHGVHPAPECHECRLTVSDIARLAVLLRGMGQPSAAAAPAAA